MKGMVFILLFLLLAAAPGVSPAVEIGEKAPLFEAESTAGTIRLEDYAGKKNVLLAFYFKDFTGG